MSRLTTHEFCSKEDIAFSVEMYSRMKYGCIASTKLMAKELAATIITHLKANVAPGKTIFLVGAPYKEIPVASTLLAQFTLMRLKDLPQAHDWTFKNFRIFREQSYDVDYGKLSQEERDKLISGDKFQCDFTRLENGHVYFIDDILITGSHERNMERMLACKQVEFDHTYTYYAQLVDPECDPGIEAYLNYAFVKEDGSNISTFLATVMQGKGLELNTRLCKFLLRLPVKDFRQALTHLDRATISRLELYTYLNDYNENPNYDGNFGRLCSHIHYL